MADWFTLGELASHLQQDVDTSTATLARANAQALIQSHTGQLIEEGTSTLAVLPVLLDDRFAALGYARGAELPQRPATAVTAVVADGVTLPAASYEWDGFQLVGVSTTERRVSVTYTHGVATVPAGVKACALMVAARLYRNPDQLSQESIADYSATFGRAAGLTPAEVTALPRWLR